jgi:hypothetical protein
MQVTYHLSSPEELNQKLIDSIKLAFESNPILITIESEETESELKDEQKQILDERLEEDNSELVDENQFWETYDRKFNL